VAKGPREEVGHLADPVGRSSMSASVQTVELKTLSTPFGAVVVIIYASLPMGRQRGRLCFKSGNAAILEGGRRHCISNQHSFSGLMVSTQPAMRCRIPEQRDHGVPTTDRGRGPKFFFFCRETAFAHSIFDVCRPAKEATGLIRPSRSVSKVPVISSTKGVATVR